MAIGQTGPVYEIFRDRQPPVGEKFPHRHAALKRHAVYYPRADDHIGLSIQDGLHKLRDETRIVLMIGMQHDDNVGSQPERLQITGFLVSAVAAILDVDDHGQAKRARHIDGLVLAHIVDEDDTGNEVFGNVRIRPLQCFSSVVCRQDNDDSRRVIHDVSVHLRPRGVGIPLLKRRE